MAKLNLTIKTTLYKKYYKSPKVSEGFETCLSGSVWNIVDYLQVSLLMFLVCLYRELLREQSRKKIT